MRLSTTLMGHLYSWRPLVFILLAVSVGCWSVAPSNLVSDFPRHRTQLEAIATALRTLHQATPISGFHVDSSSRVIYHSSSSHTLSLSDALTLVPEPLRPALAVLDKAGPTVALNANVREDGTVVICTYTGGALGSHAGYLFPGTSPLDCRKLFDSSMTCAPIPNGSGWQTWNG